MAASALICVVVNWFTTIPRLVVPENASAPVIVPPASGTAAMAATFPFNFWMADNTVSALEMVPAPDV